MNRTTGDVSPRCAAMVGEQGCPSLPPYFTKSSRLVSRRWSGIKFPIASPDGRSLRVARDVDFAKLPEGPPKWETGLINNT
jgi:hypothetical protein